MAVGGALLQPSHGCCLQLLLLLGLGTLSRSTATLCPHPTKMLAVLLGSHSQWVLNVQVMLPTLAEDAQGWSCRQPRAAQIPRVCNRNGIAIDCPGFLLLFAL